MSLLLAAVAGPLIFAAAWEFAGLGSPPTVARAGRRLRANRGALLVKGSGAATGGLAFWLIHPVVPVRLVPVLATALLVAGFLAPDAWAERTARRRRARLVEALPDALDLLAVGAAAGRSPGPLLAEVAAGSRGPLAQELRVTVAEVGTGAPVALALERLRERSKAAEIGALVAALERSRRYGSPLADQLHAQAAVLRRDERRRVDERAARAAPKIQLVVALVLVPSALLAIAAALIAHSDALLGSL